MRNIAKSLTAAVTTAVALVGLHPAALASVLAYESFTPGFPVYAGGGTGFETAAWAGAGNTLSATSLCRIGLQTKGGSLLSESNGGISRNLTAPLGVAGTTVYISFLIQPQSDLSGFGYSGLFVGSATSTLFIGKPGNGATGLYVMESFGGAGQVASNVPVVPGSTTLLVLKAEFTAANEKFTLYANPVPGAAEPPNGVVKTDLDVGTVQGLSLYSIGHTFAFDEIRVGTTYADVVPFNDKERCK